MLTRPGSESILLSLLNAVLRPEQAIVSVTILNPELDKAAIANRGVVLDLRLRLQDGSQINVEMQTGMRPGLRKRILYHWARLYSSQLVRGDQFNALAKCVSVFLLGYNELQSNRYHSTFRVTEAHGHEPLTDQLELHLVQLCRLPDPQSPEAAQERLLVDWGRFFMAKDDKEREDIAMSDPELGKAKQVLDELSADPVAQRLAADREEGFLLYHFELHEARRLGVAEGREEGQRKLLVGQARARFGEVPSEVVEHIDAAKSEQLLRWGESLMTAESLDEWCASIVKEY